MAQTDCTDYLHTLFDLGQILYSSLDLKRVLNTAIEQVVHFVQAERGFILLVEDQTRRVWGMSAYGMNLQMLEEALSGKVNESDPEISRTIIEDALIKGQPVISLNAMEDPRYSLHKSIQLAHVRSVLCVPIFRMPRETCDADGKCEYCRATRRKTCAVQNGKTLGVIYLDTRVRTGVFTEHHAEMLTAFAQQAAGAIENAHLYENLRSSTEERLNLQQALHEQESKRIALEETNRFKSEFIGVVSHELRNPLTIIRGFVQTLADPSSADIPAKERAEYYEIIEAESDRMLTLISDLLDASRLEAHRPLSLNMRPVFILPLIERILKFARYDKKWTEKHSVRFTTRGDLPMISIDPDKFTQIVVNVIGNAIKYSPDGGLIGVEANRIDDGVEILIKDQGIGMTPDQCDKLFGKFERIERDEIKQISGTGIGLYLSRHLVELHGGRITCKSEPGFGSEFQMVFPIANTSAPS